MADQQSRGTTDPFERRAYRSRKLQLSKSSPQFDRTLIGRIESKARVVVEVTARSRLGGATGGVRLAWLFAENGHGNRPGASIETGAILKAL